MRMPTRERGGGSTPRMRPKVGKRETEREKRETERETDMRIETDSGRTKETNRDRTKERAERLPTQCPRYCIVRLFQMHFYSRVLTRRPPVTPPRIAFNKAGSRVKLSGRFCVPRRMTDGIDGIDGRCLTGTPMETQLRTGAGIF